MTQHTPTPWSAHGLTIMANSVRDLVVVADGDHARGTYDEGVANAALIVRAVNSHDTLVAALEALFAMVKGECPSLLENDHHFDLVADALALAKSPTHQSNNSPRSQDSIQHRTI